MKNKLYAVVTALLISGCASSPMPEKHYQELSNFIGYIQKCFEKEHISPKLYADTRSAFSYVLSTWDYDQNKLSSMMGSAYVKAYPNDQNCRQIEANAYQMLSAVSQRKMDKKESSEAWKDAMKEVNKNKPVYCNTIGTMTICN